VDHRRPDRAVQRAAGHARVVKSGPVTLPLLQQSPRSLPSRSSMGC
jgi:hypothetical protein